VNIHDLPIMGSFRELREHMCPEQGSNPRSRCSSDPETLSGYNMNVAGV
jgi:hypothetical protein